MNPVAASLLGKLLAQVERGGRPTIPITSHSAGEYFRVRSPQQREQIHATLQNAESAGAIRLEWGTGIASRDLKRILLADVERLAGFLGVPRATTLADEIEQAVRPLLAQAPAWLTDAFAQGLEKWRRGQEAWRLSPADGESIARLFRIACAVARGEQEGLDLRRFSVRLLGDSKAIERQQSRLATLLRANPDWETLDDNDQLFQFLGLVKFPPTVFLRGPLILRYGAEGRTPVDWDLTALRPFAGLAPDAVRDLRPNGSVSGVLTIENLASFQRHVREIDDDAIVFYTAGCPSPALLQLLTGLDAALPPECPFFHWGDRDPGGLRILAAIADACPRHPLRAHRMNEPAREWKPFTEQEQRALRRLAERGGLVASLAQVWLEKRLGRMEQEESDPLAPV